MANEQPKNYDKLVKILQYAAIALMVAMVVVAIVFMKKYNISVRNAASLKQYLTGGTWVIAAILVAVTVVKSFALVFPPAVIFVLSGMVFGSLWQAWLVNLVATAASLILPYYLGRFTGKGMVDTLKKRFKKVQQMEDFVDTNNFALVFVIKAGGFLPSDVTSLIFGAMNIPFGRYFLAANLGMLPLNLLWTLVGAKGDVTNPLSFLYVLPVLIFAIAAAFGMSRFSKKKASKAAADAQSAAETDT